jgi:hypothetical protein
MLIVDNFFLKRQKWELLTIFFGKLDGKTAKMKQKMAGVRKRLGASGEEAHRT